MSTNELSLEVNLRGIDRKYSLENLKTKKELEKALKQDMKGIVRTPALSFGYENRSMKELNLEQYEVSLFEGLHDLKGKNVHTKC